MRRASPSPTMLIATTRYRPNPWSAPRITATTIHSTALTGTAAAAQRSSSTPIAAAIGARSATASTATTSVPTASRASHGLIAALTPVPGRDTSRATAI